MDDQKIKLLRKWTVNMLQGFGWEVDRQSESINANLKTENYGFDQIDNINHPTSQNSVWECGQAQGIYFLDSEDRSISMKFCKLDEDFDDFASETFIAELDFEGNRGAQVKFRNANDKQRVLTTAELASYFLEKLQNHNR